MRSYYGDFLIRDWQPDDREAAANVIRSILIEYS